jgi:hypothetical protein
MIRTSLFSLKRTKSFWDEDAVDADYDCSEKSAKRLRNVQVFSLQTVASTQRARNGSRDDARNCSLAEIHGKEARYLMEADISTINTKTSATATVEDGISDPRQLENLLDHAVFHHTQEKSYSELVVAAAPSALRLSHDENPCISSNITSSMKHKAGELKKYDEQDASVLQLNSMLKRASFKSSVGMRPVSKDGLA